jgi:hypothetical protein
MRYTGLNPNGINQVASGSVSISVENIRVATFGIDTLQVTGSTTLSGSLAVTGPQTLNGNLQVTGSSTLSGSLTVTGPQITNGNTVVTGSFTVVTGSAVELEVTNLGVKIGNASSDTHTITGSLNTSGSISTVGPVISLGSFSITSGSAGFDVTQSLTHTNSTGSFIYGLDVAPVFTNNAPGQTQTAFRVNATFTGSYTGSSTSNIIADFGTSISGSQFSINDVNSGSIYMVTDGTGLPLIEAFSDGIVNIYDYPYAVISKSGSYVNLGNPMSNGVPSAVTVQSDLIINEGVGFSTRISQNSGSTTGATTSSLYTLTFPPGNVAYITSVVTGYDSASRQSIAGEVKASVKYSGSVASIIGTNFRFLNSDNATVGFNIVAGGTSGSLEVYGTGSRTYFWAATTTTQLL